MIVVQQTTPLSVDKVFRLRAYNSVLDDALSFARGDAFFLVTPRLKGGRADFLFLKDARVCAKHLRLFAESAGSARFSFDTKVTVAVLMSTHIISVYILCTHAWSEQMHTE